MKTFQELIKVAGFGFAFLWLLTIDLAIGAPGDVEAGFHPNSPSFVSTVTVQPNGKILIGGNSFVFRLEPDGAVDFNFNPYGQINCLAVLSDGKLLIGGTSGFSGYLGRLHPDGTVDAEFIASFDGAVFCMAPQEDGRIVAGGYFSLAGGMTRRGIARLNADGSPDPSFNPEVGPETSSSVSSVALQADGKIVLAGNFTTVGGVSRPYIARVNPDGSVDAGFNPVADGRIWNVAMQKDGKILVAGDFSTIGGTARNGFARLNSDGTLDAFFDPGLDDRPFNIAVQTDGKILLSASSSFGGTPQRRSIIRLYTDGSRDAGFNASTSEPPQAMALQADGRVLFTGRFTDSAGNLQNGLLRMHNNPAVSALELEGSSGLHWLRDGAGPEAGSAVFQKRATGATSWTQLGTAQRVADGWEITGVTIPAGGAMRVLGRTKEGGLVQQLLALGEAAPVLAVEQSGQTLTSGLGEQSFGAVYGTNERELNFKVLNTGNGTLGPLSISFAGANPGDFTVVRAPVSEVAAFESTLVTVRFAPLAAGVKTATLNIGSNAPGSPFIVYLAGERRDRLDPSFDSPAAAALVREGFSAEGMTFGDISLTFAPPFDSVLTAVDNTGVSPISGRLSDLPDNSVVSAVFNGETFRFIVSYSGGTGNDLTLTRFRPGQIDAPFDAGYIESINAIALQADGKILIGGHFSLSGPPSRVEMARLNADGTIDPFFNPAPGNTIQTICVQPDGKILTGGFFGTIAGATRNRFARLHDDGTIDAGFNPDVNGPVYCVALQADGKILLGGQFTSVGGVARQAFARLHADGTLDAAFNPNPVRAFGAAVRSIAVQGDGKILFGGLFTTVGGVARSSFARLNPNGSLDTAFNPAPNNGENLISSIALQADGKIMVGGGFTVISGAVRNGLARLNANGSIDTGFTSNISSPPSTIVLQTDGRILPGGPFNTAGGLPRNYVTRLSPSGVVESAFNPGLNMSLSNTVNSICVQGDGRILLAGQISTYGNHNFARYGLVRVLNDSVGSTMSLEGGSTVRWLRGGAAQEVSSVTISVRANGAPAWTTAGMADRIAGGWEFSGLSLPAAGGAIQAVGRTSDGNAGSGLLREVLSFGPATPGLNVQQPAGNVVPAGTGSVSFGTLYGMNPRTLTFTMENTGNTTLDPLKVTFSGDHPEDYSLVVAPDSALPPFGRSLFTVRCVAQAAGMRLATLSIANPVPGMNPLVIGLSSERLDDLSPSFATAADVPLSMQGFTAQGMNLGTLTLGFAPLSNTVLTVVNNMAASAPISGRFSDLPHGGLVTAVFAGTTFTFLASYLGGTGNDLTLTRFGPGTFDVSFTPNPSSTVRSLALQADGKILVGGTFTTIAGFPRNRLARLNVDGTVDSSFFPFLDSVVYCIAVQPDGKVLAGGEFSGAPNRIARLMPDGSPEWTFNPNANGTVRCVAVEPDGGILVGGAFTSLGGVTRNRFARLEEDGTLQGSFNPDVNGTVFCATPAPEGKILIGGSFTTVGGNARSFLARLQPDGTLDTGFSPVLNAGVNSLAVQSDGRILIGGAFTSLSGEVRNRMARLHADGTVDASFDPNAGDGTVTAIAVQTDGRILITGGFTSMGGSPRSSLARVNADGSLDSAFASGVSSTVDALAIESNGRVIIGGFFSSPAPGVGYGLARLGNDAAETLLEATEPAVLRWLRSGASPEVSAVTFDVRAPGESDWTSLGAAERIAGGWELTGLSLPAGGEVRARGLSGGSLMESVAAIRTDAERWRLRYFGSHLNTGDGANLADPDLDGLTNVVEFAYGLNPTRPDTGALPEFQRNGGEITASFATPGGVSGITYGAEQSSTMQPGSWVAIPDTGTGGQHRFSISGNAGRTFLRLKVVAP